MKGRYLFHLFSLSIHNPVFKYSDPYSLLVSSSELIGGVDDEVVA